MPREKARGNDVVGAGIIRYLRSLVRISLSPPKTTAIDYHKAESDDDLTFVPEVYLLIMGSRNSSDTIRRDRKQ